MSEDKLVTRARILAGKGAQVDGGFTYSVPAADLVQYSIMINTLADELEAAGGAIDRLVSEREKLCDTIQRVRMWSTEVRAARSLPFGEDLRAILDGEAK